MVLLIWLVAIASDSLVAPKTQRSIETDSSKPVGAMSESVTASSDFTGVRFSERTTQADQAPTPAKHLATGLDIIKPNFFQTSKEVIRSGPWKPVSFSPPLSFWQINQDPASNPATLPPAEPVKLVQNTSFVANDATQVQSRNKTTFDCNHTRSQISAVSSVQNLPGPVPVKIVLPPTPAEPLKTIHTIHIHHIPEPSKFSDRQVFQSSDIGFEHRTGREEQGSLSQPHYRLPQNRFNSYFHFGPFGVSEPAELETKPTEKNSGWFGDDREELRRIPLPAVAADRDRWAKSGIQGRLQRHRSRQGHLWRWNRRRIRRPSSEDPGHNQQQPIR